MDGSRQSNACVRLHKSCLYLRQAHLLRRASSSSSSSSSGVGVHWMTSNIALRMSMQMSSEESVQETGYNQLFSVAPNTNNKEYLCGFASIAYPEFYFFFEGRGYEFNSDYIFTRLGTCFAYCSVPLSYNALQFWGYKNFGSINPFIPFAYASWLCLLSLDQNAEKSLVSSSRHLHLQFRHSAVYFVASKQNDEWHKYIERGNLCSYYDLYVVGQHGLLCVVKWRRFVGNCRGIRVKLNQLV